MRGLKGRAIGIVICINSHHAGLDANNLRIALVASLRTRRILTRRAYFMTDDRRSRIAGVFVGLFVLGVGLVFVVIIAVLALTLPVKIIT